MEYADFAIICAFFERFGDLCDFKPDTKELMKMLQNTDEVAPELLDIHVRLLRKLRKVVHVSKWERALTKFCYSYNFSDAYEIERFGYKKANLAVKLRVLKSLLEMQFDSNTKFKAIINSMAATDLRSEPVGRDEFGNVYWCTLDDQCNMRVYQENLDDETWKIVANGREELVQLIELLKGNKPIKPNLEDIIDEDSSSNSVSLKIESKPTEKEYSIKSDDTNFPLKQTIKIVSNYDKAKESEENEDSESDSNVSEYDASSQGKDTISESSANTSQKRKQEELVKAKVPPSKKIVLNAPVSKKIVEPEPDSEDLDEEEEEEEYSSEDEVGPAIEEPVRLVKGEGSGKNCKSPNPCFELEIGECIEESIMYFYGEGAGQESLVGNTGKEEPQKEGSGNKQLFFFGKPGCLNNSPVKSPPQSSMFSLSMPSGNPKPMLVDYDSDSDSNSMDKKEDSKEAISNAEVPNKEENNCQSELKEPEKGEMTLLEKITQALNDDSEESKPKVEKNHSTDGSLASPSDLSTQSTHDKTDNAILKEAKVVASWKIEKDGVFANKSTVLEKNLENIITSEIIESPVVDQKIDVCETSIESQKESLIVEKSIENIVRKIPEAPIESTHTVDESTIKIPSTQNDESIEIAIAAIEPVQEIDNSVIEQSESDEHNSNQIDEISEKCEEKLQIDDEINFSESISNAETTKTLEINENEVLVESVCPIPEKEIIPEESIETSSTQERDLVIEESPDILAPTINEGELNSIEEPNSTVQNEILQTEPIVQMEICPEEVSDLSINQLPIELTIDEKLDIDNLSEVSDEDDDILNQTDTNGPKSLDEQINQEPERSIPREFLNEISVENIDEISQNENNLRDDEKIESPESQIQSSSIIEASPEVIDEIPMPSVDHNSNSQTLEIVQNPEVVTSEPKQSDTVLEIIQPIAEIPIASNSPLKEAENLEIDEDKMSIDDDESQGSLNIVESNHEIPEEPLCKMESAERLSYEKEEYVPCMSKETVNRDIILELEPIPDSAKSLELPIDTDVESQIIVPSSSQSLPEFIPAADSVKINKPIKHQLHVDEPVCVAKFFTPLVDENEEPKAIQPETPVDLQQHQPMETVENLSQQEVQFPTKISKETKDPEPITSSMLSEPNSLEIECLINVQSPKQIPPSAIDIQPHLPSEAQKLEVTSIPEINEIPIIPKKSQGQEKVAKILEEKISGELLSAPIDSKLIAEKANTSKAIPLIVEKIAEVTNPISLKKIAPIALENPAIKVLQSHESSPELPFKGFEKFECEQDIEMEEISKSTDNPFESIKLNENLSPRKRMTLLPANRKRRYSKDKPSTTESESDDLSHSDAAVSPPEVSADENEEDKEVELASKKPKIREKLVPVPPKKKQALRKEASPIKEEIKPEPTMSKLRSANREPPKAPPPKVAKKPVVSKKIIVPDVPIVEETDLLPESKKIIVSEPITPKIELKFDYDPSEAEATVSKEAIIAQVKSLKKKEETSESKSSSDENEPPVKARRGRKPKAAKRVPAKKEVKSSDSSDDENEKAISSKAKTTVPATEADVTPLAKKRGRGASKVVGLLRNLDTSLVIATPETDSPVRQSRRIAQQKVREETDRRRIEEKLLKQMKADAERKKKSGVDEVEDPSGQSSDTEENSKDATYVDEIKKKKKKLKPIDKPWQTSSDDNNVSEPEEEDYMLEQRRSDHGSPLFRSDHEFSCESDVENGEGLPVPTKRARTAKKTKKEEASSSDEEEINPNHLCQVCHTPDHPEWILLCDDCDHGYHCACLKPVLFLIPEGDWFCPKCQHKKLIDNLTKQLAVFDSRVNDFEVKKVETQEKERIEAEILVENEKTAKEERERAAEESSDSNSKKSGSSTANSSDDEPIYKLRRRAQANVSYRFNDYDDLIYSAIRRDMEDVDDEKKGLGNSGRGKDISTIIEAGQEGEADENNDADEPQKDVKPKPSGKQMGDDSEDSDEIKRPKKTKGKKRARKLNNLEVSSEDDARDEDFKIKESSSDSDEAYSMSSVSESSLEYARGRKKQDRSSTRTRRKRFESKFIDDNSSDDEPLVQTVKRKKNKSDSEEFDVDDEDSDGESNENEDIDSDDLCDDSETESSEGNWPKKKKRAPASYDKRPAKKKVKRTEDEDKAFRAGISTKKLLKDQVEKAEDNKDSSESEDETKRRKTRGKKLLYLMEDDLESSDDGIKPGVKRPDTPPEEREMFIKKQEEIKRMLAAKNTEAAKQLAAPNIEPIQIMLNKPPPPPVLPGGPISDSLSTIPKQVIESARALDTDYLRKAPISAGMELPDDFNPEDMNEEELAKMMEEEDFAQHQLKLAGEAIARTKKIKEQEGKKDGAEKPKRGRKSKADKALEAISAQPPSVAPTTVVAQSAIIPISMPQHPADVQMSRPSAIASLQTFTNHPQHPPSKLIQQLQTTLSAPPTSMMPLGAIPNQPPPQLLQHHHHMRPSMPPQGPNMMPVGPGMYGPGMYPRPSHMGQPPMERRGPSIFHDAQQQPSMLPTTLMNVHPSQMHHQQPIPQIVPQQESPESKKRGRRKKFTPLRTDLPNDPNDPQQSPSKSAEFGSPNSTSSTPERSDPKVSESSLKLSVAAPPQLYNPSSAGASVITKLLQPQRPPMPPYGPGGIPGSDRHFTAQMQKHQQNVMVRGMAPQPGHLGIAPNINASHLPPDSHFNPRSALPTHPMYRPPQGMYGLPPGARPMPYHGPPTSIHHALHAANQGPRPLGHQEYPGGPPFGMPPNFGYYAPQPPHAHRRPPTGSLHPSQPQPHQIAQQPASVEPHHNPAPPHGNTQEEEGSGTSEFGGLAAYFSSQQELD